MISNCMPSGLPTTAWPARPCVWTASGYRASLSRQARGLAQPAPAAIKRRPHARRWCRAHTQRPVPAAARARPARLLARVHGPEAQGVHEPYEHQFLGHLQDARDPHLGPANLRPCHGHLHRTNARALREVQELHVEGPPAGLEVAEQALPRAPSQELEPALRVPHRAPYDEDHEEVEGPHEEVAVPAAPRDRGALQVRAGARSEEGRGGGVPLPVEAGLQQVQVREARGAVRVGHEQ
mmetsp:Transcript_19170/g.64221  ORF Transcript_19170/g.64221 Transcript_19170/m.64221 type:complete len:238 (+) Transcript_19170:133-846(+)